MNKFDFSNIKKIVLSLFCLGLVFSSCTNFTDTEDSDRLNDSTSFNVKNAYPQANVEQPVFDEEGVPKNRKIVINFSKSIDADLFWEKIIISDSAGNNLKQHFLAPVWSNDGKTVVINADESNLIEITSKNGKKDIYVTVPKSIKDINGLSLQTGIDYKYRISEETDTVAPELFEVYAQRPSSYIYKDDDQTVTLVNGEYKLSNEEKICTVNHINSKLDFYVEGQDNAQGQIYADLKFRRVYDAEGNAVSEPDSYKTEKLKDVNLDGHFFGQFCLDLSSTDYSAYLDGMYRIEVKVSDECGLYSSSSEVYYIIRDTTPVYSTNSLILFEAPSYIEKSLVPQEQKDLISAFDVQNARIKDIENFCYRIQFDNIADDVYFVSRSGKTCSYSKDDFDYYISWGLSLNDLTDPVKIDGYYVTDPLLTNMQDKVLSRNKKFNLPSEYKTFRERYLNKDIYLQAVIVDSVGNQNIINTLVPRQVVFYNYEVAEGSENGKKKIRLNYSDMTSGLTKLSNIPDKVNKVTYRVFYGKKVQGLFEKDIILKRNISLDYDYEPYSLTSDLPEFEIEEDCEYTAYIQPVYIISSKLNGQFSGQTFGPLVKVDVSGKKEASDNIEVPEFIVQKESAGLNTGLYNIIINISNAEDDVQYIPCYSLDGQNWNYYEVDLDSSSDELCFSVETPLKAPLEKDGEWSWVRGGWNGKSLFEVRNELANYGPVKGYVRILAVKDKDSIYSQVQTVSFIQDDDNIAPEQNSLISSHDSRLSFDGRSFIYDNLVSEADGHTMQNFIWYYTEYNQIWGNNLSVLSQDQIELLPANKGNLDSVSWNEQGAAVYTLSPVITLNGLKDGKYMFFAKVSDIYGNYRFITLGKADVGTFKNKLTVDYDSVNNKFISTLKCALEETFDRNMINIQSLSGTQNEQTKEWKDCAWYNFYGSQNELQDCTVISKGSERILKNETVNEYKYIENGIERKVYHSLVPGKFYRISVQGFNENVYNSNDGKGVNKIYGRPYTNNLKNKNVENYIANETEYDLCTQETVSNTVYYYIPANASELKDFKGSLFSSTGSVRSNKPVIINVISSMNNLGNDVDEWERRGKLVATHYYSGDAANDPVVFNDKAAGQDMNASDVSGKAWYVIIAHFANNTSAISPVYEYFTNSL